MRIMRRLMGAAAFIMAEKPGVGYLSIHWYIDTLNYWCAENWVIGGCYGTGRFWGSGVAGWVVIAVVWWVVFVQSLCCTANNPILVGSGYFPAYCVIPDIAVPDHIPCLALLLILPGLPSLLDILVRCPFQTTLSVFLDFDPTSKKIACPRC